MVKLSPRGQSIIGALAILGEVVLAVSIPAAAIVGGDDARIPSLSTVELAQAPASTPPHEA